MRLPSIYVLVVFSLIGAQTSAGEKAPYEDAEARHEPSKLTETEHIEDQEHHQDAGDVSDRQLESARCSYDGCDRDLWNNSDASWTDNLNIFLGLEGSKQPQEFGVNAHFGGRASINWAGQLIDGSNLGIQIGTAINYTDNAVQVYERFGEARGRSQNFTTVGLFQRLDCGLLWGATWDHLHQNYYDEFDIDQFRARLGYMVDEVNEFGIRASIGAKRDFGTFLGSAIRVGLEPVTQGTVYWRHFWPNNADTTMWIGIAESHGERNLAFEALLGDPTQRPSGPRLVFGAEINVPLNDHFALFGQGNFVTPAYTGTVDSYLGVAYYPGGTAQWARKNRFSPLHPVANSTNFSVDLR